MQLNCHVAVTSQRRLLARASPYTTTTTRFPVYVLYFVIFPFIYIFNAFDFYFYVVFSQIAVSLASAAIFVIIL